MAKNIQAIRGMHDVLPDRTPIWQFLERRVADVLATYGYREIRMPLLELTELFKRSIGEVTDIVEKEMYTFLDRNGDSLTLRPEGTAGCVRAAMENGLLHNQTQRLWYQGPMFRHERPQKGRFRQFHQIGHAEELIGIHRRHELRQRPDYPQQRADRQCHAQKRHPCLHLPRHVASQGGDLRRLGLPGVGQPG